MIVSALIDSIKELLPFSNTFSGWFYSGEVLYVSTGISSLLLVLLTLLAKFRNWPTWPLVWLFSLLLSVYAIWTTLQNPSSQATTVMVFMVLLPTMFVLAPWKQLVAILLLVIIFNLLAWEYKTPASYTADSWNSVFFGTVGVISGFYFDRVMLIALANELVRYFGHELSFRFGGDEFLAVASDESLPEVEKKCDQLLENLQKQGFHVSLGISQQRVDQLELKQLLFEADKAMRQAKEAYYQDTEHDRQAR
ncbi:diguanylate cyclase domain-containing protein [Lactobacillus porci]|nr:diguanylate cyclase [Lactobacillus porci]